MTLKSFMRWLAGYSMKVPKNFRWAHANSLESQNALTVDKQLELFGQAIEQEKQAIAMQAEAIENHKQACRIWRMQVTDRNVTGIPKARLRQSEISYSTVSGKAISASAISLTT